MKTSIIKKLIILLLFSVNAGILQETLDRCTLPLNGLNAQGSENNFIIIKGHSILKSVKETEVIPLT